MEETNKEFRFPKLNVKVIGVGGGGVSALNVLVKRSIEGFEFVAVDSDINSLETAMCKTKIRIQTGAEEEGETSEESSNRQKINKAVFSMKPEFEKLFADTDLVMILAGMGGAAGAGGATAIAEIAKKRGALTLAFVSMPFHFEGESRMNRTEKALKELIEKADTLFILNPNRVIDEFDEDITAEAAFGAMNDRLTDVLSELSDILNSRFIVNFGFEDFRRLCLNGGGGIVARSTAQSLEEITEAAKKLLRSPFLFGGRLSDATKVALIFTFGKDYSFNALRLAGDAVRRYLNDEAQIMLSYREDEAQTACVKITVIAAHFKGKTPDTSEGAVFH